MPEPALSVHTADPQLQALAEALAALPDVIAVARGGSVAAGVADALSDWDLYVISTAPVPVADRRALAERFAGAEYGRVEVGNPFWGPGDEWALRESGQSVDLVYWEAAWIEEQLARVLDRHEAWVGYTTCFWYTILHSEPLIDPSGWYARLQDKARQPYPEALRRAIVANNYPLLRQVRSSFRHQIESALIRQDRVSLNHRTAALLASVFDVIFAANAVPNPGEKRLLDLTIRFCPTLPHNLPVLVNRLVEAVGAPWEHQPILACIDALVDSLEVMLIGQGLLDADGNVVR
ncbi:MAG TPA: hypothetical protein PKD09_24650 [Aggregatilinea sp.]|uniref:hypothetical protein n=1 Tax=Aggregatilinea sp. TaxID=2806333 RepID=UPI002B7E12DD|nr:hypothetical protein [Aggregatilinea sp.]HML24868.1 hypothetical protein [Aggregatilinea sp.]